MITVHVRLYEELNRLLPLGERKREIPRSLPEWASLGDLIDELGLDRSEVDLALINSRPASFSDELADGDRVSLYPEFESLDIQGVSQLRSGALRIPRFVLPEGLSNLAGLLEDLGYDCLCPLNASSDLLARISLQEERILLTRDPQMAGHYSLDRCFCLTSDHPESQLAETIRRFQLRAPPGSGIS